VKKDMTMRELYLPLALVAAALAGGCTLAPYYERPAPPVASEYPSGAAYQHNTASTRPLAAADLGWQDFFGDPRLKQLITLALHHNRDLRVAMLNVQASRDQYRVERASLFPALGANASQSSGRTPASLSNTGQAVVGNAYNVGGTAQWQLDFFGRLQSLKNQALYQYLATAEARKAAEILLVSEVADQYLALRASDEQLNLTQATLQSSQASYQLTQAQYTAGSASELDMRQAKTVVDLALANLASQKRAQAQAENALVLLVGEPLPVGLPAGLRFDDGRMVSNVPAGLPADLLTRRPDIMAAEDSLRAANANIGAARAAFFPTISITGSGGSASSVLSGLFKAGSAAWTFVPNLTVPIFSAGSNLANLDLAHVEKNIAVANYEKTIQTAFREVADGLAASGTYSDQLYAQMRYTFDYQRTLDLSTLRYQAGTDSYLQVLTAQNALYSAQQNEIATRLDVWTTRIGLYDALGGGWLAKTGDMPRDAAAVPSDGADQAPAAGQTGAAGDAGQAGDAGDAGKAAVAGHA
jgi:multidrug efflux system outer membrane protein